MCFNDELLQAGEDKIFYSHCDNINVVSFNIPSRHSIKSHVSFQTNNGPGIVPLGYLSDLNHPELEAGLGAQLLPCRARPRHLEVHSDQQTQLDQVRPCLTFVVTAGTTQILFQHDC